MKSAYSDLTKVCHILGVKDEASKLREHLGRFNESPVSSQYVATPPIDLNVILQGGSKTLPTIFLRQKIIRRHLRSIMR